MKKWINLYFDFSKREFNGLLILLVIIGAFALAPFLIHTLAKADDSAATDQQIVAALSAQISSAEQQKYQEHHGTTKYKWTKPGKMKKEKLFRFDPNTIDLEGWQSLGLSEKQGLAILKYTAKGGRFKKKEDLQKMYTISPEMYARLAPYISISSPKMITARETQAYGKSTEAGRPVRDIIEINAADSSLLCEIIGIGPVFASRIIKYRARTGGFYKKEQLMEIYGLDSLKYAEIAGQVRADPGLLKRIKINSAQLEDLRNNPYLRYKQINALIEYRKQHGNYSNIADLNKVVLLSPQTVARLAPYLVFE